MTCPKARSAPLPPWLHSLTHRHPGDGGRRRQVPDQLIMRRGPDLLASPGLVTESLDSLNLSSARLLPDMRLARLAACGPRQKSAVVGDEASCREARGRIQPHNTVSTVGSG